MNYTREIDQAVWAATHCQDPVEQLALWQAELSALQDREAFLSPLQPARTFGCNKTRASGEALKKRRELLRIRRHDLPIAQAVISRLS